MQVKHTIFGLQFDFWRSPSFKNAPVDIMVPPHRQAQFQDVIQMLKIDTKQIIDNVQRYSSSRFKPLQYRISLPIIALMLPGTAYAMCKNQYLAILNLCPLILALMLPGTA